MINVISYFLDFMTAFNSGLNFTIVLTVLLSKGRGVYIEDPLISNQFLWICTKVYPIGITVIARSWFIAITAICSLETHNVCEKFIQEVNMDVRNFSSVLAEDFQLVLS